uniref:Ycf1 n=1 Tax=Romanomermis culicivorax TaxID=13658 RepID=A0A915HFE0_ROMCU
NKKKQKFIKSLDEFLTSCDEDQIKHDPILEKLETEDTIKKARQFINNQNFQTNRPRMDNFPQYSWKFEKKDNFDEMINARLRQVFPESNTFSSLFVPMHDRRENSPIRKSNVEMELESLKNWLKKFEKEIK